MSDPKLEYLNAIRLAVQHEVRRGYRDDCKALVEEAWLKILTILDERYQPKKGTKVPK